MRIGWRKMDNPDDSAQGPGKFPAFASTLEVRGENPGDLMYVGCR